MRTAFGSGRLACAAAAAFMFSLAASGAAHADPVSYANGTAALTYRSSGMDAVIFNPGPVTYSWGGVSQNLEGSGEWQSLGKADGSWNGEGISGPGVQGGVQVSYDVSSDTNGYVRGTGSMASTIDLGGAAAGPVMKATVGATLMDSATRAGSDAVAQMSFIERFSLAPGATVSFLLDYDGSYGLSGVGTGRDGLAGMGFWMAGGLTDPGTNDSYPGVLDGQANEWTVDNFQQSMNGQVVRSVTNVGDQWATGYINVFVNAETYTWGAAAVPEPSSAAMTLGGLLAMGMMAYSRRHQVQGRRVTPENQLSGN